MLEKIGFAHPCAGHFIQEFRHTIENAKKSRRCFMIEGLDIPDIFQTLEEAEVWCKANPKKHQIRRYGTGFRS